MRPTASLLALASLVLVPSIPQTRAEEAPASSEAVIAAAVLPAPSSLRDSATVLGWREDGGVEVLRQGSGDLTCLADTPGDARFHVACYHKALEPFMARGRELRAQGVEREEILRIREEEIVGGRLSMPTGPSALYSLTGPVENYDAATGQVAGGTRVSVVYIPFATEASTGLPPEPVTPGGPWLMSAGKPWAHIMIVQPAEVPADDADSEADASGPAS
jgi:hypothetical protein